MTFILFKDEVSESELVELQAVFDQFSNEEFLNFEVDKLVLVRHHDDLQRNYEVLKTIELNNIQDVQDGSDASARTREGQATPTAEEVDIVLGELDLTAFNLVEHNLIALGLDALHRIEEEAPRRLLQLLAEGESGRDPPSSIHVRAPPETLLSINPALRDLLTRASGLVYTDRNRQVWIILDPRILDATNPELVLTLVHEAVEAHRISQGYDNDSAHQAGVRAEERLSAPPKEDSTGPHSRITPVFVGYLDETVDWLRANGHEDKIPTLTETYADTYAEMQERFPVLEQEITGRITIEICEHFGVLCEMNVYTRTLRMDVTILDSSYMFARALKEEWGHLARSLLDPRSGIKEGPVFGDSHTVEATSLDKTEEYFEFWAFEEFVTDYAKAFRFDKDFKAAMSIGTSAVEELIQFQAEAIALLIRRANAAERDCFIGVILKAISGNHKSWLLKELERLGVSDELLDKHFKNYPTFTNDADLVIAMKECCQEAYPKHLYYYIEPLGYHQLVKKKNEVIAYYESLWGLFGRGIYHGLNKQKLLRKRALAGEGAFYDFYDLLVIVCEDTSETETRQLVEEARGVSIPENANVLVIAQPTVDTPKDRQVKGNYSAVINLLVEHYHEFEPYERNGSICVVLSAGTGSRNAPLTFSGWADKGKQACLNGEPFLHQIFKQVYHYYSPDFKGMVVTSNDGIKAIANNVQLGEYGIEMLGAVRICEDQELDDLGTALVEWDADTYAKPIIKMVEKAPYAERKSPLLYGEGALVPTNWADYFFSWAAIKLMREHYSQLILPAEDGEDTYMHLKYGLDTASDLLEAITTKGEETYVKERVEKGWNLEHAITLWKTAAAIVNDGSVGGSFGFVDTGKESIFVDTGTNEVYFKVGKKLTLGEGDIDSNDPEAVAELSWARATRMLLDLPEPNENGQVIRVHGSAYFCGKFYTEEELRNSEVIREKIGERVLLAGKNIVIGKVVRYIGRDSVVINPMVNILEVHHNSFVYFVEESGKLHTEPNTLVCDVYTKNGKVRVHMPVEHNAKDAIGRWAAVRSHQEGPVGHVHITNERVVKEEGSSSALEGARLKREKDNKGTGKLLDDERRILEAVGLIKELTLWDVTVWPRNPKLVAKPVAFHEQSEAGQSFGSLREGLDRGAISIRYSPERATAFLQECGLLPAEVEAETEEPEVSEVAPTDDGESIGQTVLAPINEAGQTVEGPPVTREHAHSLGQLHMCLQVIVVSGDNKIIYYTRGEGVETSQGKCAVLSIHLGPEEIGSQGQALRDLISGSLYLSDDSIKSIDHLGYFAKSGRPDHVGADVEEGALFIYHSEKQNNELMSVYVCKLKEVASDITASANLAISDTTLIAEFQFTSLKALLESYTTFPEKYNSSLRFLLRSKVLLISSYVGGVDPSDPPVTSGRTREGKTTPFSEELRVAFEGIDVSDFDVVDGHFEDIGLTALSSIRENHVAKLLRDRFSRGHVRAPPQALLDRSPRLRNIFERVSGLVYFDQSGQLWILIAPDVLSENHAELIPTLVHESVEAYYRLISGLDAEQAHKKAVEAELRYVAEGLVRRVEKRLNATIDLHVRLEIMDEIVVAFRNGSLLGLVEDSFTRTRISGTQSVDEVVKIMVFREAGLLLNALPLLSHGGRYAAVDVRLNDQALEKMRAARTKFRERYQELVASVRSYWRHKLPDYQGEVINYNKKERTPKVSVNVIALASRLHLLLQKRIEEISQSSIKEDIELIITIADPQNMSPDHWGALHRFIVFSEVETRVVLSNRNTISINRNIGSLLSRGQYRIFLDDDVRLVGPVIENLVTALEENPEVGVVSVPSYDTDMNTFKPRWHNLMHPIAKDLFVATPIFGMILATRADIVKVLPFVHFWPNNGEDRQFIQQVTKLGYLSTYLMSEDSYVVHEHVEFRATSNPRALVDCLACEGFMQYLEPSAYDDEATESLAVRWLQSYGRGNVSQDSVLAFWKGFRSSVTSFLDGDARAFDRTFRGFAEQNEWFRENEELVTDAINYFRTNKLDIVAFAKGQYREKDLSEVNPLLGPIEYEVQEEPVAAERTVVLSPVEEPVATASITASAEESTTEALASQAAQTRAAGKKVIMMVAMEGWSKKGGQADYIRELSQALTQDGNMVIVVGPYFMSAHSDISSEEGNYLFDREIPVGGGTIPVKVFHNNIDGVHYLRYKDTAAILHRVVYPEKGNEILGLPYPDSPYGYIEGVLLSQMGMHVAAQLKIKVDDLHFNDWQAGIGPAYMETSYRNDPSYKDFVGDAGTLIIAHNMAYQGKFDGTLLLEQDGPLLNYIIDRGILTHEWFGYHNGIAHINVFHLTRLP